MLQIVLIMLQVVLRTNAYKQMETYWILIIFFQI